MKNYAKKPTLKWNQKNVILYLQQQIIDDIDHFLSRDEKYSYLLGKDHKTKIWHFVSYLYMKPLVDKKYTDRREYVFINCNLLIHLYGSRYYKDILDALLKYQIILMNPKVYSVGVSTNSYGLNPKYLGSKFTHLSLPKGNKLAKKLLRNRGQKKTYNGTIYGGNRKTSKLVYVYLKRELQTVSIQHQEAEEFILDNLRDQLALPSTAMEIKPPSKYKNGKVIVSKALTSTEAQEQYSGLLKEVKSILGDDVHISQPVPLWVLKKLLDKYYSHLLSIHRIKNQDFFLVVDETAARVHTNLTSLSSELRQFIRLRGEVIAGSDLKNSQPLFLALELRKRYSCDNLPEDAKLYIEECIRGTFYQYFADKAGVDLKDAKQKKDFKETIFEKIFFGKLPKKKWNKLVKLFKNLFPAVWDLIVELKSDVKTFGIDKAHAQLSILLQQQEQYIFVVLASEECRKRKIPILTLHDSIYTFPEYKEEVREIILKKFVKEHNVVPTLAD